ncbi:MAG: GNAT family N-acetyltransferase [Butyrivibrio sp.]|nr:GNAT family N-acetyltransferase [Butyrivibrio sp.]
MDEQNTSEIRVIAVQGDGLEKVKNYFPKVIYRQLASGHADALGAVAGDTLVGVLAFQNTEGVLEIEWAMVAPSYRRQNVCEEMIMTFMELVGMDLSVEKIIITLDSDTESRYLENFFKRIGFLKKDSDIEHCTYPMEKLAENPYLQNAQEYSEIRPLEELSKKQIQIIERIMRENMGLDLDGVSVSEDYDPQLSLYYIEENEPKGFVLVRRLQDDLELSVVYIDPAYSAQLLRLLLTLMQKVKSGGDIKGQIVMDLINEASRKLTEKMLPGAKYSSQIQMELNY